MFPSRTVIIPKQLYYIIEQAKEERANNRIIFHGPPGTGKTTLSQDIADELNAEYIEIKAATIVTRYQGSGSEKLNEVFENAVSVQYSGKKVVLLIDEVDSIANQKNQDKVDHYSATLTIANWIDTIKKKYPKITVILATNNYKELNKTLVNRFGRNIIKIDNPNGMTRKEAIETKIKKSDKENLFKLKLDPKNFLVLVKKTKGLGLRSIEDIMDDLTGKASRNKGLITENDIKETLDFFKANHEIKTEPSSFEKNWSKISKINKEAYYIIGTVAAVIGLYYLIKNNVFPKPSNGGGPQTNYNLTITDDQAKELLTKLQNNHNLLK